MKKGICLLLVAMVLVRTASAAMVRTPDGRYKYVPVDPNTVIHVDDDIKFYLKDGSIVEGQVTEVTDDSYRVESDGKWKIVNQAEVDKFVRKSLDSQGQYQTVQQQGSNSGLSAWGVIGVVLTVLFVIGLVSYASGNSASSSGSHGSGGSSY